MKKIQVKDIKRWRKGGYVIKEFSNMVLIRNYPKGHQFKNILDFWEEFSNGIISVASGLILLVYTPIKLIRNLIPRFYRKYKK